MPKSVKGDPFGFFNVHPVAKYQKNEGGHFGDIKKIRKKSHKAEKGAGKSHSAKKLERGPFWVLYFKLEAFGCVPNQVEYFW